MGADNVIFQTARIGERPQDLSFRGSDSEIVIGDRNAFHEGVTVHGATKPGGVTRIGNDNCFMPGAHLAHDCRVADRCFFGENALVGGHCSIETGAHLGSNSAVHQFCRLGRRSCLAAASVITQDLPPFVRQERINRVADLNWEGMNEAGLSDAEKDALRQVFDYLYLQRRVISVALALIERDCGAFAVVRDFVAFLRNSKRGISTGLSRPDLDSAARSLPAA
jgi:UDP-N-acetylglucosamine acyltransferase